MAANRSINRPQIGTRQGMVGARLLVRGVPRRLLFVTWFMSQLPSLSSGTEGEEEPSPSGPGRVQVPQVENTPTIKGWYNLGCNGTCKGR